MLGEVDALPEAAVGQLQARHDVADRIDAGHVGLQIGVDRHEAAVEGDAVFSYPTPVVRGPRPTATSNTSAVMVLPSSRVTVTLLSSWAAEEKRTPVWKVILRLRKARSRALEQASSSAGTRWGGPRRWSHRCRRISTRWRTRRR